ncbi:hypothetical protein D3C72_800470 [compost metagenome]
MGVVVVIRMAVLAGLVANMFVIMAVVVPVIMPMQVVRRQRGHAGREATDAEDARQIHLSVVRAQDLRALVQVMKPGGQRIEPFGAHQVGLVQNDAVRRHDLVHRLVVEAGELRVVQVRFDVHGIHQRQDAVERHLLRHVVVHEEGGRHRRGVGQPAGFHEDMVEALRLGQQRLENAHEVGPHIHHAADAAVGHLVDLLVRGHHQIRIDIHLAKLVLDDRDAVAVLLR